MQTGASAPRAAFFEERFGWFVSILIVTVAVLAAVVTFMQTGASARADRASRDAQQYAIRAMGARTRGEAEIGHALYSAQKWFELGRLAASAQEAGDVPATNRYRIVQQRLGELSPLLSPAYSLDIRKYEADTYLVGMVALSEQYATAVDLENTWDAKAREYVSQLALLAITLFLFGLSTTVASTIRWLFVATGTLIANAAILWLLLVANRPVAALPPAAIDAYARGVALAYQDDFPAAVAAFDEALARAPGYANALYERGNAQAALQNHEAAVTDYLATRRAGRDDTAVAWNLGWSYYLLGRFAEAADTNRRALAVDPTLIPVRLNLGLALLAAGQSDAARQEYGAALDLASTLVGAERSAGRELPYSFWVYLDIGAADLESLLDRLNGTVHPWTEAPPGAAIAEPAAVESAAQELLVQLKSHRVALEQTGRPPGENPTARITALAAGVPEVEGGGGGGGGTSYQPAGPLSPFEAGTALDLELKTYFPNSGGPQESFRWTRPSRASLVDFFPAGTEQVALFYDFEGMSGGQQVLWRVYANGQEDLTLRRTEEWSLGESGSAEKFIEFVFGAPAEYTVEVYVDSHLMQRASFVVGSE